MSEPPEREEEDPEDPAAGADLEELLEQFREPEEAPRKRANPLWLISAILLSVLAGWLALRASGGSAEEKPESVALTGAMLPGKTSERLPGKEGPVDVVEDYMARCKKGMTAQEVRWIVEDFQRAGLGEGPGSLAAEITAILSPLGDLNDTSKLKDLPIDEATATLLKQKGLKLARLQQEWYASAIADGLRLTPLQRKEIAQSGERFVNERVSDFLELEIASVTANFGGPTSENFLRSRFPGGIREIDLLFPGTGLLEASHWIQSQDRAPWNMVELAPEQEAVTRRSEVEEEEHQQAEESGNETIWTSPWLDRATPFRRSLTDKREIHLADGDFGPLAAAGSIFPLEEIQLFEGDEFVRINDPTRLHPAQLKMLLLLEPERAAEILQALEQADK